MSDDNQMLNIFLDVFGGLPRQGPGSDESTLKALSYCKDALPSVPQILDIGCGSGMQTRALARALPSAEIIATDFHQQMLDEFEQALGQSDLKERITLQQADMTALEFDEGQFDLLWCEGAIYIMGVESALKAWRPLLKEGGFIGFSEVVWLKPNVPKPIVDFWETEYPHMGDADMKMAQIRASGFDVIGHFTVPAVDWWTHFYTHLEAGLVEASAKYGTTTEGQAIIAGVRQELAMRRQYGEWYSYEFFVCQKL